MAFYLLVAQTMVGVAGMALVGQLLVGVFNWKLRHKNLLYQLFEIVARPIVKLVRLISPKVVLDRHVPVAAFMILLFAYFWLGFEHRDACKANVNQPACEKWAAAWDQPTSQ